ERLSSHYSGAIVRQLALLGRSLLGGNWMESPSELTDEARRLVETARLLNRAESDALELAICSLAAELWLNKRSATLAQTVTQPVGVPSRRLSAHKLPNSNWKTA